MPDNPIQTNSSKAEALRPRCTYIICSSPRTGSTLLASALEETNSAGRPAEYFDIHEHNEDVWRTRLNIISEEDYLDRVVRRATTDNGVCGFKLHWHQLDRLLLRLSTSSSPQNVSSLPLSPADMLHQQFGRVRHIWVRRRNKVAQGISYYLAARSGVWQLPKNMPVSNTRPAIPEFDLPEIDRCVALCRSFDQAWETYFRSNGVAPLIVVYESFIESYAATVRGVLDFLELHGLADVHIPPPRLERQASPLSQEWEQRYRAAMAPKTDPVPQKPGLAARRSETGATDGPQSYLICTLPRSGSTLLTDALASVGVAGRPDEFFASAWIREQMEWLRLHHGIESEARLLDLIVEKGSTPNGIFGAKVHWANCGALRRTLVAAAGQTVGAGEDAALELLVRHGFRAPRYIWLRRRNAVAQAISHYRAARTGIWRAVVGRNDQDSAVDAELPFDYDAIDRALAQIHEHDWQWGNYFTANRLTPLMIFYEDLVANFENTIRGILKFLRLPYEGVPIASPDLEKQADERSIEWERTYRELKEAGGQPVSARPGGGNLQDVAPLIAAGQSRPVDGKHSASPPPSAISSHVDPALEQLPFVAYRTVPEAKVPLIAAPVRRVWMDETPNRFAYRCLPMLIANQSGWFIQNFRAFEVTWDGGNSLQALKISALDGMQLDHAMSHFGAGILTFTIPYLFRTPPGFNLLVRGPANIPKDGVYALEGVVETDWAEATFTMNWKMTRPHHRLIFEIGEPIAMITPIRRGDLELMAPEVRPLSDNRSLEQGYRDWSRSRSSFNADLKVDMSPARRQGWERHYMRGTTVGQVSSEDHQTGLALKEFLQARIVTRR